MNGSEARRLLRSIAANIRAERLRRGWSQLHLAEAADLSPRYIVEIERGVVNVGAVALASVAGALDVPPGRLFQAAELEKRAPGRPRGVAENRPRRRS